MDWVTREIITGFQALASLSLDRTPASDVLPMTVQVWTTVVTDGRSFDEALDVKRFREAFVILAGGSRWPTPKDFIAALPERSQLRLAKTALVADPARAAAACAEIAKAFRS